MCGWRKNIFEKAPEFYWLIKNHDVIMYKTKNNEEIENMINYNYHIIYLTSQANCSNIIIETNDVKRMQL